MREMKASCGSERRVSECSKRNILERTAYEATIDRSFVATEERLIGKTRSDLARDRNVREKHVLFDKLVRLLAFESGTVVR